MTSYELPKVWHWDDEKESKSGNRPDAGSRFDQDLPVGDADLQVYSLGTPNGIKVTVMLEELLAAGVEEADYDLYKINIGDGDQFGSDFVAINPNSKIPAMVDRSQNPALNLFESGSILLYLAEKFHYFLPEDNHSRAEVLNWVFWQTGAGPYVGGGFGHFFNYAPEAMKYPIDRFTMETKRQLDLLDKILADRDYIAGSDYSIADMMIWPWYGRLALGELYEGSDVFLAVDQYKNLQAWAKKINQRPAVQAALAADYQAIKEEND
ncbi:glutathione-dependent disulfide-bond oxidoreductase [Aerococcus kribbianus]|uniref:Glutathione-dependent disulfide-bond oxidoreductase n=1 Tax=Aerococcus kribbianus TaxID=2999064 RepID=A0A9X3JEP6_9LACT|nr:MULTISPECIES: glutathione-dependent disulfide-bond oxidoreductase [unclassified Aerococcus]MCZ0717379.1 glutathione-dependent disulfide-bond oxidoreductase [Aerococcus sp. YH-aer221]MCZ0725667.1 glutathione-dependent disulfide-bond oxidoreductase [Aerococcus sp. YH-aer222]